MGWLQGNQQAQKGEIFDLSKIKQAVEHIEDSDSRCHDGIDRKTEPADVGKETQRQYSFLPESTPDEDFPFIPTETVNSKRRPGLPTRKGFSASNPGRRDYWIVVDSMVYDCTDFILDHPGGEQVIMSFLGEDCSWQFWRFHGQTQMEQYGRALRIGRTTGVENRFKEPNRYVGLSRLGHDEW